MQSRMYSSCFSEEKRLESSESMAERKNGCRKNKYRGKANLFDLFFNYLTERCDTSEAVGAVGGTRLTDEPRACREPITVHDCSASILTANQNGRLVRMEFHGVIACQAHFKRIIL